jgi:nucleoside-diphosphate-sugar epimerase
MRASARNDVNRVLVTGGAGYLGSILVAQLLESGFKVRVLDSLLFGDDSFKELKSNGNFELIRGDVRDVEIVVRTMTGCDAVIHLAGIVGDHACNENQQLAQEVNRAATRMLVDVAPRCGVRRFLFASSCSVYGSSDRRVDECSKTRPLSLYAQTKIDSERILLSARTGEFAPTIFRLGTLFGLSPRMRFDLVVNLLVARAISTGRITINNGWQWRPFVHVRDAARAFLICLKMPASFVSGELFNTGSNSLNLQIKKLGDAVAKLVPDTTITSLFNRLDRRSYRVSFDKICDGLGFHCTEDLESGMREIRAALYSVEFRDRMCGGADTRFRIRPLAEVGGIDLLPLPKLEVVAKAKKGAESTTSSAAKPFKAASVGRA